MRPKRQRLGDSLTALDRYFREYFADCANAFGLLRIVPDPAFGSCAGMVLFSIPSTVSIANYLAIPWSASSPSTDTTCYSTIGAIRALNPVAGWAGALLALISHRLAEEK